MTIFFPQGIAQFAEAVVSVRRIQKFLTYEEVEGALGVSMTDPDKEKDGDSLGSSDKDVDTRKEAAKMKQSESDGLKENSTTEHLSEAGVIVDSVTARWDPKATEYTLEGVNLHVQPGTLVAVIGPVGAGKSSLMHAILGELPLEGGTIKVNGEVSYASQEPWLFSASIRQNILFGLPMEKERYKKVVKTCALERDFQLFANGDKTIVGERGVSLSGGQKARISLARAVYRRASVYLLDDPLSAVDSHVGRHLFDHCMRDYLKGKIVILITHQLQYLQNADQIVILKHGKVEAVGSYDSLRETGLDFAQLLAAPSGKEEDDSTDTESFKKSGSLYKRQSSESSMDSAAADGEPSEPVINEEKRQKGSIGFEIYKAYCKASGGYTVVFFLMIAFILSQLAASGGDYFLTYWVNKEETRVVATSSLTTDETNSTDPSILNMNNGTEFGSENATGNALSEIFNDLFKAFRGLGDSDDDERYIDIYIFTGLTVATVVITLGRSMFFFQVCLHSYVPYLES